MFKKKKHFNKTKQKKVIMEAAQKRWKLKDFIFSLFLDIDDTEVGNVSCKN